MLKREIKRGDLVLLLINSVIGAGIFGLPSKIFALSGLYSLLAFVACAVAILIIVLCFAEVSSRFKSTGGPYLYILEAFGRTPAFGMGWLLLLSRLFNYGTLINLMVVYLSIFSPAFQQPIVRVIAIAVASLLLAVANYIGVKDSVRLNNILTVGKLLPLLLFIVVGFFFLKPELLQTQMPFELDGFSRSVMLLIFAFGGFESILVNTGEIKEPRKHLPFALLTATLIIIGIYCSIQLVSIGTLATLAGSERPLADAATLFLGSNGGKLMAIGAFVSIVGTLNALMLSGSRLPYALSLEGQLPRFLSVVHPRFHTPSVSILIFTIAAMLISISGSFMKLISIATIIRILVYFFVCASLIRLRKSEPRVDYYKLKYGFVYAIVGMIICVVLLTNTTAAEVLNTGYALAAGVVLYAITRITAAKRAS